MQAAATMPRKRKRDEVSGTSGSGTEEYEVPASRPESSVSNKSTAEVTRPGQKKRNRRTKIRPPFTSLEELFGSDFTEKTGLPWPTPEDVARRPNLFKQGHPACTYDNQMRFKSNYRLSFLKTHEEQKEAAKKHSIRNNNRNKRKRHEQKLAVIETHLRSANESLTRCVSRDYENRKASGTTRSRITRQGEVQDIEEFQTGEVVDLQQLPQSEDATPAAPPTTPASNTPEEPVFFRRQVARRRRIGRTVGDAPCRAERDVGEIRARTPQSQSPTVEMEVRAPTDETPSVPAPSRTTSPAIDMSIEAAENDAATRLSALTRMVSVTARDDLQRLDSLIVESQMLCIQYSKYRQQLHFCLYMHISRSKRYNRQPTRMCVNERQRKCYACRYGTARKYSRSTGQAVGSA